VPGTHPAQDEGAAPAPGTDPAPRSVDLEAVLEAHARWLASGGRRGRRAELADADLSGADLAGRNLTRAILAGTDLSGADLSEAVLDHARMIRARLGGADLLGASLVEADLTWATLSGARMGSAVLIGACLAEADLTGARLKGADFTNADLEGADLRGADLAGTVMNGTDLTGTVFDAAPATDAGMDAAYEAEEVFEHHDEAVAVSELPDADLEEHAEAAEAERVGAEAWVGAAPSPAPEPVAAPPEPHPAPSAAPIYATYPDRARALAAVLEAHARWLASGGSRGERAGLAGFDLEGLSLRHADLRRADLGGAENLAPAALAGADLAGAALPEGARFPDLERVAALSRRAGRLFILLLAACLYTALAIGAGAGRPLAAGTAALRLPLLGTDVPVLWFYGGAPVVVLALYLWLQLYLQRMWEALGRLPARFPDGRALDEACDPWLPAGTVRAHLPRLAGARPPLLRLQRVLSAVLLWGVAPATLAFLWGGFLLRVGPWESAFHALVAAAAFGFALHAHLLARRTLRGG
jgi:uncharacterized protein YjbI with pentapeptide repeats